MILEGHRSVARVAHEAEQVGKFFFCYEICVFIMENGDILSGKKVFHVWNGDTDRLNICLGEILYKLSREV